MRFMPAAWQVKVARKAQERWNAEHPECWVPWEWVEECLLAWRALKERASYAPSECKAERERYEEFARKLPGDILKGIFPTPEASCE